jgi:hypothetical protein
MNLHLLELFGRQTSGLRDDVFGNRQFANVMQQRRGVQRFQFRASHAQFLGYFNGINPNPLQVFVRGLVFGFDGQRQRLNGAQMQIGDFFDVDFFVLDFAQLKPV